MRYVSWVSLLFGFGFLMSGCAPKIVASLTTSTNTSAAGALSGLSYSQASLLLGAGVTAPNIPVTLTNGVATSFTVSPGLPAGLVLNSSTGTISGKPASLAVNTGYVVTAHSASGATTSTTLNLRVMHPAQDFNSGYSNLMFLRSGGNVWAWGEANGGRNGTAETVNPQPSLYAMPAAVSANVT